MNACTEHYLPQDSNHTITTLSYLQHHSIALICINSPSHSTSTSHVIRIIKTSTLLTSFPLGLHPTELASPQV